jgi:predicted membrane protein
MRTIQASKRPNLVGSSVFKFKVASALAISLIADALDYFAAPLFGVPLVGDVFDAIVVSILFNITKSKMSAAINMIEFIPIIGDFIPVYTLSTLLWISKEWNSQRNYSRRTQKPSSASSISAFFARKR